MAKTGRNDPYPCGSGMKYKHCCLNSAAAKVTMEPQRPPSAQQDELLPVERLLLDGEKDSEKGNCIAACNKWIEAWEIVKTYIEDGIRSIEELNENLNWLVRPYFNV